jgi:hypothetical protein
MELHAGRTTYRPASPPATVNHAEPRDSDGGGAQHCTFGNARGPAVSIALHLYARRAVRTALFADVTDNERDQPLDYLAWYPARRRSGRVVDRAT